VEDRVYISFVSLNIVGVELSFKVTLIVTLLALSCLVVFLFAPRSIDFAKWAMNGGKAVAWRYQKKVIPGHFCRWAWQVLRPSVCSLVVSAIEQLPLAAEESVDPSGMPRGNFRRPLP
jgi:ethanolamine permease